MSQLSTVSTSKTKRQARWLSPISVRGISTRPNDTAAERRLIGVSENDYGIDIDDVGVPNEEGETWDELAQRLRRERNRWFYCACGAGYRSRRPAVRCCSDQFDDVDLPPIEDDGATGEDVADALTSE